MIDRPPDAETLSSPSFQQRLVCEPLLTITCLWHSDPTVIGASFVTDKRAITIDRFQPLFTDSNGQQFCLSDRRISRKPVKAAVSKGHFSITPPRSKMRVTVGGQLATGTTVHAHSTLADGLIVTLGAVAVLHFALRPLQSGGLHVLQRVGICGKSASMATVARALERIAPSFINVLIRGETGTGKELVARALHQLGPRPDGPFLSVNMATVQSELAAVELFGARAGAFSGQKRARLGLFRAARHGTLFLDEIGATPPAVQPMLLRVLENSEVLPVGGEDTEKVDVRVVAATDANLAEPFNQPLRRRLEAFEIELPPLDSRREDIGLLVEHFAAADQSLRRHDHPIDATVATRFALAPWPGNVRELRTAVRKFLVGQVLPEPADAALDVGTAPTRVKAGPRRNATTITNHALLQALDQNGWNLSHTAASLKVARSTLYAVLDRSGLERDVTTLPQSELQALRCGKEDLAEAAVRLRIRQESLRRVLREHS